MLHKTWLKLNTVHQLYIKLSVIIFNNLFLQEVSRFSMGCSIAQFFVLIVIICYCFTQIGTWQWNKIRFNYSVKEFPVSIGVIVFSYTSQLFLPSLEGDMENRRQFKVNFYKLMRISIFDRD